MKCMNLKELQLHHYHTFDLLWNKWKKENNIKITCVDDVMAVRDDFIAAHEYELYDDVATLCKQCHNFKLHKIYGQKPSLATADKQRRWVAKQAAKRKE